MLHLETVEPSTLELLIRLQGLNSLKETRLVGGTALSLQYGHRQLFNNFIIATIVAIIPLLLLPW